MENPFQQFATNAEEENPFAQFVKPQEENPFAQFVQKEEPQVAVSPVEPAVTEPAAAVAPTSVAEPVAEVATTEEAPSVAGEPAKTTSGFDIGAIPEQFKSGLAGLQKGFFANVGRNNAAILNVMDLIDRGEYVVPEKDVIGYQEMNPEQRAAYKDTFLRALGSNIEAYQEYQKEQQKYVRNVTADEFIKLADQDDYAGAWKAFKSDPLGIIQQLSVESLPNVLPAMAGGAAGIALRGGLSSAAIGFGTGTFPVEFMASIAESLAESGVDLKDPKAIEAMLRDQRFIDEAGKRAVTRGQVISASGAASTAMMSPLVAGNIFKNIGIAAGNLTKGLVGEGGGEAAAMAATGEEIKVGQVLAEMIGAGPQTVASTAYSTIAESRKPDEVAPEPKVEPTVEETAPVAETTAPAFDPQGYLDTPAYEEAAAQYKLGSARYDQLEAQRNQFPEGSVERDQATDALADFFDNELRPLIDQLDAIRSDWAKQVPEVAPETAVTEEAMVAEEKPLTDKDVLWIDEVQPEATQAPEKIIVPESDFQDTQAIFDALDIKPGLEETNKKISRAEPTFTEESIQQPVEEARVEPTFTEAITPSDTQVSKEALPELPTEGLVVPKGRNRQVVAAGKLFQEGKMSREDFNRYVDAYTPIRETPVEELEPPTSTDKILGFFKSPKETERVNKEIADGTQVGLRMDLPAKNAGLPVVSIHEGKPNINPKTGKPYAKAGEVVKYASTAYIKNVEFAPRSQEKSLNMGLNPVKEPLQTAEGEFVNLSPEETFKRVKELTGTEGWTQVGFDPARHGYFYDRATGEPVVRASELYQVGRFLLAKDVEYANRNEFLYNVGKKNKRKEFKTLDGFTFYLTEDGKVVDNLNPDKVDMSWDSFDDFMKSTSNLRTIFPDQEIASSNSAEQIRKDNIAKYASLKQKLAAIQRRFVQDKNKPFDKESYKYLSLQAQDLKDVIESTKEPKTSPADFLARAAKELADGNISQEVYDVVDAMYKKNPQLLNGLRLSVKAATGKAVDLDLSGQFLPFTKIVRLFKESSGTTDPSTLRHEITHSLEQLMSKDAQAGVVDAWGKALLKAKRQAKTDAEKNFFVKVGDFIASPNNDTMQLAVNAMPDYSYYQYINPSEFWAVNAETLMESYLGGGWQRFKTSIKGLFEALKNVLGFNNKSSVYKTFNSVINADRERKSPMLTDYVSMVGKMLPAYNIPKTFKGQPAPTAAFTAPEETGKNEFVRKYINDKVYIEKTLEKIRETNQPISEKLEAYLKEKLASSRAAYQHKKFKTQEVEPLLKDMKRLKISDDQLSEFLLASHAEERNNYIASINPNLPDGGSSMDTQEAKDYMDSLSPERKANLQSVADQVYKIINGTGDLYVASGDQKSSTIQGWRKLFQNYVPLNRTEEDFSTGSFGLGGAGYNVSGSPTKKTTGSKSRQVKSILENVIHQRDNAIDRGERIRVGNALIGLALQFPNPKFWLPIMPSAIKNQKAAAAQLAALGTEGAVINNLMSQPTVPVVNPKTGLVEYVANPAGLYGSNVFHTRINGENAYIVFNANEPSAKLMAESLNKMSPEEIGKALSVFGKGTKAFSSLMTQYNPVWGLLVNLPRDAIFSFINAFTLPIQGKKFDFIMKVIPAMIGSWNALRNERQGLPVDGKYAKAFEEMSEAGGRTLYRDSFVNMQKDGEFLEKEMARLNRGNLKKVAYGIVNLMGDFNDALESGFRVAAYMTAKDLGLSKDQAANIAKEITVNFDRRGAKTRRASMLYSFLNANIQGNLQVTRILRSKQGKAIATSLFGFGVTQALILNAAGFEDDDIPDYIKDRYFLIPLGANKAYQKIPMPPGLSLITNLGRISTEMALDTVQGKDVQFGKKVPQFLASILNSFSPLGATTENLLLAPVPTLLRPPAAVLMNKDQFGRPISREDTRAQPSPGYLRSSQAASEVGNLAAYIINKVTFGSDFEKGYASPTGNDLDYIVKQYTPGIFKEIRDAAKFSIDSTRGDVVNVGQVPLLNKLVGSASDTTNDSRKFYDNVTQVNKHYYNYKNSLDNDNDVAADSLLNRHPEIELNGFANSLVKQIARLNKEKMRITKEGGSRAEIQEIERDKLELMREFNEQFKEARIGR